VVRDRPAVRVPNVDAAVDASDAARSVAAPSSHKRASNPTSVEY
jgi:hypothetical protein